MPAAKSSITNEHDFIRLMKSKDISAIDVVYNHYAPVLYGVIFRITNDEKKSEEILCETFTYIWNHFNEVDVTVQNVCFWMLSVARQFCFETLKPEERMTMENEWEFFMHGNSTDKKLSMLGYAFFKGMNVEQMAGKFKCTENVVRMELHNAVNHLKNEYFSK
ncbi:MAG: hypothetical protein IPO83_15145 [Chitinophagaceae bacterium]|nr:hypothetical protein [Chitinophagaceae bacterium]